jgi:hypothetical protein
MGYEFGGQQAPIKVKLISSLAGQNDFTKLKQAINTLSGSG